MEARSFQPQPNGVPSKGKEKESNYTESEVEQDPSSNRATCLDYEERIKTKPFLQDKERDLLYFPSNDIEVVSEPRQQRTEYSPVTVGPLPKISFFFLHPSLKAHHVFIYYCCPIWHDLTLLWYLNSVRLRCEETRIWIGTWRIVWTSSPADGP